MNMQRTKFYLSAVAGLLSSALIAQTPKDSNEFLASVVDGRGLGLSGAMSSLLNDATAGDWNPAGLTR